MSQQEGQREELARAMNMGDVLALAFGTMIGWGWIMLAGQWVGTGGTVGAILAFALGAVMCMFVGLAYAELTPALPLSGGELVFSFRAMGYNASWFTGWMITLAYVGVAAWEGPAIANALDYLFKPYLPAGPTLWTIEGSSVGTTFLIIGIVGALILTIINVNGVKTAATFQTVATIAMAIGGVAFFVCGVIKGDTDYLVPAFTNKTGLVTVILMVPAMFVGFDVIPQAAEEMNIPLPKIGQVIVISILLAAAWYMLMVFACAISAPHEVRYDPNDPGKIGVAEAFTYAMNSPVFGKIIIVAAMCGILTSWNGFFIGASRVLFSMGRARMLPKIFAQVNPKHKSPQFAIILVGIICMISPVLGKGALVWFVDAAAMGTVVAYFMVSLSYLILKKKEPELKRPYEIKGGGGIFVGIMAVAVALFFLYLYLPLGSPAPLTGIEWGIVGIWLVLGVIFFLINQASLKKEYNTPEKKEEWKKFVEYMMFGDEYKRF
ncbi:MAG: APC family permease [Anaerovoracaceae bacterium]|jgi:APA family basic amino acid/polyamine antiporter